MTIPEQAVEAVKETYVRFGWGGRAGSDALIRAALEAALPSLVGVQRREDMAGGAFDIKAEAQRRSREFVEAGFRSLGVPSLEPYIAIIAELLEDAMRDALLPHTGQQQEGDDFNCKGRHSSYGEPADCNWPHCGCDPHVARVMDGLRESGWIDEREAQELRALSAAPASPRAEHERDTPVVKPIGQEK